MTSVVLLGDFPTVGLRGAAMAARIPLAGPGSGPAAAHDLAERLDPLLAGGEAVLALYPSWRERADLPVLRMARSLLDARRLAFGAVPLPPLALSFVADQCAHLAPHVDPGVLTGLLPRLARAVAAGAWVSSVARLAHVQIGLRQHVRSYLPRAGFMVTVSPTPEVHRVTEADPVAAWPGRLIGPVMMLVSDQQGDPGWIHDRLRVSLLAQSVSLTPPQPSSAAYWGTSRFSEFVVWSGHPQAMQILIRGMSCRPCPWCGELTGLPTCAFCHAAQPPGTAVPQPDLPDLWTTIPTPPAPPSSVPPPPPAPPPPAPPPSASPSSAPPPPAPPSPASPPPAPASPAPASAPPPPASAPWPAGKHGREGPPAPAPPTAPAPPASAPWPVGKHGWEDPPAPASSALPPVPPPPAPASSMPAPPTSASAPPPPAPASPTSVSAPPPPAPASPTSVSASPTSVSAPAPTVSESWMVGKYGRGELSAEVTRPEVLAESDSGAAGPSCPPAKPPSFGAPAVPPR